MLSSGPLSITDERAHPMTRCRTTCLKETRAIKQRRSCYSKRTTAMSLNSFEELRSCRVQGLQCPGVEEKVVHSACNQHLLVCCASSSSENGHHSLHTPQPPHKKKAIARALRNVFATLSKVCTVLLLLKLLLEENDRSMKTAQFVKLR